MHTHAHIHKYTHKHTPMVRADQRLTPLVHSSRKTDCRRWSKILQRSKPAVCRPAPFPAQELSPPEPTAQTCVGDEHCCRLRASGEGGRGKHNVGEYRSGQKCPLLLTFFKTHRRDVRFKFRSAAGEWVAVLCTRYVSPALVRGLQQWGQKKRERLICPDAVSQSDCRQVSVIQP